MLTEINYPAKDYCGYTISAEKLENCVLEVAKMHIEYWKTKKADIYHSFNPDYKIVFDLENSDKFVQFIIKKNGEIVGCAGFFVDNSIETGIKTASESFFFIKEEHRKAMLFQSLILYSIHFLLCVGVEDVHVTISNQKLKKILERMGLIEVSTSFKATKKTILGGVE